MNKTRIYAAAGLAVAVVIGYFALFHSGYSYDKNNLTIPPGVTCQMEVKSWISEGEGGMPMVLSDLKTVKADLDGRQVNAVNTDSGSLLSDTANLNQNLPPGCVPDLSFYEGTLVNSLDTAISAEQEAVYLMRAGKPLNLAIPDKDFTAAISVTAEALRRLAAYSK